MVDLIIFDLSSIIMFTTLFNFNKAIRMYACVVFTVIEEFMFIYPEYLLGTEVFYNMFLVRTWSCLALCACGRNPITY